MAEQRYIDGIQQALKEEMTRDDTIRVLGEDVTLGGPFGATKGLVEEFTVSRIINTPISEATIVGMAVGAAVTGLRPVLEIMFIDNHITCNRIYFMQFSLSYCPIRFSHSKQKM